jgi:hypothetical protein
MRAEIALCNTSETFEEELIRDLSDTAVLAKAENSDLSVVIAADKKIFIIVISGKMRSAHAVDGSAVDLLKITALNDLEGLNAEVRDGI